MDRIKSHPILDVDSKPTVEFFFDDRKLLARKGEVITSALIASGINIFGRHSKDGSPQGIFCANGQCAQCMVIADGLPVKGCMTTVKPGMRVSPCNGLPELPPLDKPADGFEPIRTLTCDVLIIGGGPAGITAALEIAPHGFDVVIVDDKHDLGGKLVLQTHSFFGTVADCFAGTRGIDIAKNLADELARFPNVKVMLNSIAVGCYVDGKIGVVTGQTYLLIEPKILLVAAGARERALAFPGCDLPGVFGAGAFQTLVNRDLVKPASRLFVVGGGNVGLIASYHALQAGIDVLGLVEALPQVGGYKVHLDKLKRLGVPVWTSHTVKTVHGRESVEAITIVEVDQAFKQIEGTEKTFAVDAVLIAVGLNPVNELYEQAQRMGIESYCAGDSFEIAEASAAIFSGKIAGRQIVNSLGKKSEIPSFWLERFDVLKRKPGRTYEESDASVPPSKLFPVVRCYQEIPCDPCVHVCPKKMIKMKGDPIFGIPEIIKDECTGCMLCVAGCPGLAITLVDLRNPDYGVVTVPFELDDSNLKEGVTVEAVDYEGNFVCEAEVVRIIKRKIFDRTKLIQLRASHEDALKIAGFRVRKGSEEIRLEVSSQGDPIICRCERVRESEIRREVRRLLSEGVADLNQLKFLRCGMGACGGKTCEPLILRIFDEEGRDIGDVVGFTKRPLVTEVDLATLSGEKSQGSDKGRCKDL
ncbi:MAG: FAD-dependent oxidoreductase [bacterium]